ncbi:Txe/YoeB family addiction module toxin [Flammeovirga yaeyamensis]|uniref:Putative mRNA interferase YoeB n=1 Tax=Flammeovirga yaeyamensis TaxID=367791 RepID=A0AAX1MZ76_9BACT|nr:Txe/YoeB family addiction module toxin [Flammeovirga yaeyamensis]MBB3700885.1 toxin YoeB [Flammeovirga yaeyamensis]NMF37993.1 Txe/YoeB family addiction module toxin [Flammeovirga yaeyamensis]QWG00644.1 Txe/YoeB family addiction module toxin [Flammeovirga yaeyamensis]
MNFKTTATFDKGYKILKKKNRKSDMDKIKELIQDISINGLLCCKGSPEALKNNLSGYYSRRINKKDRLVYYVDGDDIYLYSCFGHY